MWLLQWYPCSSLIFFRILFTCDLWMQVQPRLLLHPLEELYHPRYQVQLNYLCSTSKINAWTFYYSSPTIFFKSLYLKLQLCTNANKNRKNDDNLKCAKCIINVQKPCFALAAGWHQLNSYWLNCGWYWWFCEHVERKQELKRKWLLISNVTHLTDWINQNKMLRKMKNFQDML